jgi:hypothetical protein
MLFNKSICGASSDLCVPTSAAAAADCSILVDAALQQSLERCQQLLAESYANTLGIDEDDITVHMITCGGNTVKGGETATAAQARKLLLGTGSSSMSTIANSSSINSNTSTDIGSGRQQAPSISMWSVSNAGDSDSTAGTRRRGVSWLQLSSEFMRRAATWRSVLQAAAETGADPTTEVSIQFSVPAPQDAAGRSKLAQQIEATTVQALTTGPLGKFFSEAISQNKTGPGAATTVTSLPYNSRSRPELPPAAGSKVEGNGTKPVPIEILPPAFIFPQKEPQQPKESPNVQGKAPIGYQLPHPAQSPVLPSKGMYPLPNKQPPEPPKESPKSASSSHDKQPASSILPVRPKRPYQPKPDKYRHNLRPVAAAEAAAAQQQDRQQQQQQQQDLKPQHQGKLKQHEAEVKLQQIQTLDQEQVLEQRQHQEQERRQQQPEQKEEQHNERNMVTTSKGLPSPQQLPSAADDGNKQHLTSTQAAGPSSRSSESQLQSVGKPQAPSPVSKLPVQHKSLSQATSSRMMAQPSVSADTTDAAVVMRQEEQQLPAAPSVVLDTQSMTIEDAIQLLGLRANSTDSGSAPRSRKGFVGPLLPAVRPVYTGPFIGPLRQTHPEQQQGSPEAGMDVTVDTQESAPTSPELDTWWTAAPTCRGTADVNISVMDTAGRLWGFHENNSCAFRHQNL